MSHANSSAEAMDESLQSAGPAECPSPPGKKLKVGGDVRLERRREAEQMVYQNDGSSVADIERRLHDEKRGREDLMKGLASLTSETAKLASDNNKLLTERKDMELYVSKMEKQLAEIEKQLVKKSEALDEIVWKGGAMQGEIDSLRLRLEQTERELQSARSRGKDAGSEVERLQLRIFDLERSHTDARQRLENDLEEDGGAEEQSPPRAAVGNGLVNIATVLQRGGHEAGGIATRMDDDEDGRSNELSIADDGGPPAATETRSVGGDNGMSPPASSETEEAGSPEKMAALLAVETMDEDDGTEEAGARQSCRPGGNGRRPRDSLELIRISRMTEQGTSDRADPRTEDGLKVAPKGLGDGLGSDLVTKQDDGQPLPIDKTIGGDTPQAASERTGAAPADEALKAKPSAGEATEDREVVCKKGVDTREGRRRPTETTLSIHKIKKDEGLATTATVGGAISTNAAVEGSGTSTAKRNIDDIPHLMSQLRQPNINDDQLLGAVRGLRRLLSVKGDVPAGEVLEIGALSAFVQMLQPGINSAVQFEAAWALTNIASTDKTYVIVDAGAVQPLINLLTSPDSAVREQSAWCLGNISGDSAQLRDAVLSAGGMQPLLQNISQPENKGLLSNSVWALSNLCRGKPGPPLSSIAPALPVIKNLLPVGSLLDDKADLLWSLSYISDGDDANIQAVIDAGVVEMLVDILGQDNSALVTPALRTIGNLVRGSDTQTEFCLEAGLMPKMRLLINHEKKNVRKEAAWVLSNIAAGTRAQIGQVLSSGRMQDVLSLSLEAVWEIRMECIWVLSNIAYGGSDEQVASLVSLGAIPSLVTALDMNETKMTIVALEALESILEVGDRQGDEYVSFLDESNGISTIESLQEHESEQVYNKALEIIEKFLGVDEHEEG